MDEGLKAQLRRLYYLVRPLMPRRLQIGLRRAWAKRLLRRHGDVWPIYPESDRPPFRWPGWPEGRQFCLILTHDVERERGVERCRELARIEMDLGFRSSFNFVPRRYDTPAELRRWLGEHGFEVGVHGLYHDGRLFDSRETFLQRAQAINGYLREWGATGFRAPAMHHNLEWQLALDIEYDLSTFDTDPFEPQSDGMKTIFPFRVNGAGGRPGYVEMPYTLAQDFTLFVLFRERDIRLWKTKLDWIAARGGMALLNTHPDYMAFHGQRPGIDEYPAEYYRHFLEYVQKRFAGRYWHATPREAAQYARQALTTTFEGREPVASSAASVEKGDVARCAWSS